MLHVKFVKDFPTDFGTIYEGDIYEVIRKKEPDKHVKCVRYLIKLNSVTMINIPKIYVEEV